MGNYDDPISDVRMFAEAGVEHMILVPFFDALLPYFEVRFERVDREVVAAKLADVRARYQIVFDQAKEFKNLFVCLYHRMSSNQGFGPSSSAGDCISIFNDVIREEAQHFHNIRLVVMDDLIGDVGKRFAFDERYYYLNKAPYTNKLLDSLAVQVCEATRGFGSYFYKVLVLDCDNTLWGGVIGEDLIHGTKLSAYEYPGNVFWLVQNELADLERNGVLLCLCSKNNMLDVQEMFQSHPGMVISDDMIVSKKVNWRSKFVNVQELASELSLGLESFVFLDDSDFECSEMRSQLPQVRTFQVPKNLSEYPRLIRDIKKLFLSAGITDDSLGKTKQYRVRAAAEEARARFTSHEDYLHSLNIKVRVSRNALISIPRISELTMKSNQFNLTTKRYSEGEVRALMENPASIIYSFEVSDKFGDSGLTGVIFLSSDSPYLNAEAFLMSCRVIGRGVEAAVWNFIISQSIKEGFKQLHAQFRPSAKNSQVAYFYDGLGFPSVSGLDGIRLYNLILDEYQPVPSSWIEVSYVG